ncbi:MAG: outer membrane protein assembly factor BamA [Alphaproteobacteria bacterium]
MSRRHFESRAGRATAVLVALALAGCAARTPAGRGAPVPAATGDVASSTSDSQGLITRLLSPITSLWARGDARPGDPTEAAVRATGGERLAQAGDPREQTLPPDPSRAAVLRPKRAAEDPSRWLSSPPGLRSPLPLLAVVEPPRRVATATASEPESGFHGHAPRVSGDAPVVGAIVIEGNHRVDKEAIRVHVKTRPGETYDAERADEDLRAIYAMGFFDDVSVDLEEAGGRSTMVFRVKERPYVSSVRVEGLDNLKKEDVETALKTRPRTIHDPEKVRRGIADARKVAEEKGYLDAKITPVLEPIEGTGDVELVYKVEEGKKILITDLVFEGNEHFSDRKLAGVMQTSEKSWISFITGSGTLNRENLKTDVERLTAFYYDDGYVAVKIDEPEVSREGDRLKVRIKIDEGEQFSFGEVKVSGDVPPGPEADELAKEIQAKKGEIFRASALREDVTTLTDLLGDQGYAFANVEPQTLVRPEDKTVDVAFRVSKGKPVSIGQIEITGNSKTRDKVIRREMRVAEQEPFSATQLRKSKEALQRLGFFSEVDVTTRKGATDDQIDLAVDVKEGSTGAFSAGAGYTSGDQFLFNVRLSENNLFGRGQRAVLNADFGSIRRNIFLSYTEPYLFDTRLLGQGTIFNTGLNYGDFTRAATGFSARLLYPFEEIGFGRLGWLSLEDTSFGLEYRLEQARIYDISANAPPAIWAEQGQTTISAISPQILRNTLNHAYDPTSGSFQDISFEFAGIGGDQTFWLAQARSRFFWPIYRVRDFGVFVYSIGGTIAYGKGEAGISGNELPLVQRFFLGGINTVRGYNMRTLGPREDTYNPQGIVINNRPIGGTNELVVQNEIIFPIFQPMGIRGVVFFDAGNAFTQAQGIDFGDLRYGVGAGIRWLSPFGPLRIEYGIPLNLQDNESKSSIMFSFGAPL